MPTAKLSFIAMNSLRLELASAIGERGLHFGTGAQGAEHRNGGNRLPGELRGDVVVDRREAEHVDLQLFPCFHHLFKILSGVALQAEHHLAARNAFLEDLTVCEKLVADCGTDE